MKDNKKLIIYSILITIALVGCVTFAIFSNSHYNGGNVINIDDCDGKDCNKTPDNNTGNNGSENGNGSESNSGTNNDSGNGSGSGSGNGSGSGTGTGTGNGSGNGSGTGNGSGSGTGSGSGSGTGTGTGIGPSTGTTPSTTPATVAVSDGTTTWTQNTDLKIFNVDEIKPGDSGNYEFAINNNTGGNVAYSITFSENNQYSVNMLYKLKMNGNYIAGDASTWVKYDELDLSNKVLENGYMDAFYLEWKWVDSDNDVIAGTASNAKYSLNINVSSTETSEHDVSGSGSFNPNTGDKITNYITIFLTSLVALLLLINSKEGKHENN